MSLSNRVESHRILTDTTQIRNVAEQYILQRAKTASPTQRLDILEAGCGREWTLDLGQTEYKLTGVDLDAHALDARINEMKDLDEAIVGDLCSVDLSESTYDVIFNAYVIEHIEEAHVALENFTQWLKPNGQLILLFPDRDTVYGFLTRITPHWLHVFYLRYLSPWKNKNAGKEGYGPYPTYHAPVVSRQGIEQFCQENGLSIEAEYASNTYITQNSGLKALLLRTIVSTVCLLSLGTLESRYNNLIYLIKKSPA
ncbi:MAG: class I SAM-dependent methyltransferase [Cyanobacteria bacterium J06649_4]